MQISLIPPFPWALRHIAANMNPADRSELLAGRDYSGNTEIADDAWIEMKLHESVARAYEVHVAVWDGKPIALFGCALVPDEERAVGVPFMLTTGIKPVFARTLHRAAKGFVAKWKRQHCTLWNMVHSRNTKSISWLKSLGFTVSEQEHGEFVGFWMVCDV